MVTETTVTTHTQCNDFNRFIKNDRKGVHRRVKETDEGVSC